MPKSKTRSNAKHEPYISPDDPEILEMVAQIRKVCAENGYPRYEFPNPDPPFDFNLPELDLTMPELDFDLSALEGMLSMDEAFQQMQFSTQGFFEDKFNADIAVAQIKTPVTRVGDVWQIGRHRLMCDNPSDVGAVATLMDGKKARMIFTDFSWSVDGGTEIFPGWKNRKYMGKKMSGEDFRTFLLSVLKAATSASEPGANTYIVSHPKIHGDLMFITEDAGFKWESTITWVKHNLTMLRKDYHSQYSPIWYGWQGDAERLCKQQLENQTDYWETSYPVLCNEHPTVKPIELVVRAMRCTSKDGDIILDSFGNLGTTLIAAEQTGRIAHLMESDPRYCDVIARRFAKMQKSGEDIFLLRKGKRFSYNELVESQ